MEKDEQKTDIQHACDMFCEILKKTNDLSDLLSITHKIVCLDDDELVIAAFSDGHVLVFETLYYGSANFFAELVRLLLHERKEYKNKVNKDCRTEYLRNLVR